MKNRPCPKCKEQGRDSKGDHLYLMEDGITWHCNKNCHEPYFEKEVECDTIKRKVGSMTGYTHRLSVSEIAKLPIIGNPDRKISKSLHEKLRVRTEFDEGTGNPRAIYYPEFKGGDFIGYKCRNLPKDFISVHKKPVSEGSVDFFGQKVCPHSGRRLLITAGEEDYLAACEMFLEKYPENHPCVVGLPRGEEGSNDTIADRLEFLKGFEQIVIGTDMDEAGRRAIGKIAPIIGERALVLVLSEKDISDMLVKNKKKEFINAFFQAKEYKPSSIVSVTDILEESIKPVKWGLSYPWKGLTELTYGIKEGGEIIGIGSAPGAGKSTMWQGIQSHIIMAHKEPIAIFDIEEGAELALKKLIGYHMGKAIHKPDCDYDIDEAREVGSSFEGLASFYGGDCESWDEVESATRYFISKGIRLFFVDPLSALVEHMTASEANQELGRIMRSMRKLRKHLGATFFHSNHLNNPVSGKEHGEGGKVLGSQFSGSRAQWKYSTLLLGLERNQYAEDAEEKDRLILRVIKDRLGGNTGYITLRYDKDTGVLLEDEFVEIN